MRKLVGLSILVLIFSLGLGTPAIADYSTAQDAKPQSLTSPQAGTVTGNTDGIMALPCWLTPKPGTGAVNIRRYATTASERVGIIQEGQGADAVCYVTLGGSYTACGFSDNEWVLVEWYGVWGYVAVYCTNWFHD